MSRAFASALCLLTALALSGCTKGTHSETSESPASRSPGAITSSADVVKVRRLGVLIPAGGNIDAAVLLSISPGFHVNANPATFSYLIPTEVTVGKIEGIGAGTPGYPAPEKKKFQFADQPLAVYEGEVKIKLNLRAEKDAAVGLRSLPINIRVQACNDEQCYPPTTLNSAIQVEVK